MSTVRPLLRIFANQIRVGDVATVNGTGGIVHVFPNGTISTLSNRTKGWSAMVFDIGVARLCRPPIAGPSCPKVPLL